MAAKGLSLGEVATGVTFLTLRESRGCALGYELSISAGWYLGDQVFVALDDYGWSHLINRDLREVAEALPPERTTEMRVVKGQAPTFRLSDGHDWTVFPNFFFESDIWEKGEKLKGMKTTADKWLYFIPGEESKLQAINFLATPAGAQHGGSVFSSASAWTQTTL